MIVRIILALDKPEQQRKLRRALAQADVLVDAVRGRRLLWDHIARQSADVVVVSRSLIPEPVADMIELLRQLPDSPAVVVVCEGKDSEDEAGLLAAGCEAVLSSTLSGTQVRDVIAAVLGRRVRARRMELSVIRPASAPRLQDFVSASPAMQAFMNVARRMVETDVPLLVLGETGVGKERLARALHTEGPRSEGPFIAVNCGALPEALLESELFGHEEGAFTGATRSRRGWFELAHHGTVFLDEIGDMPQHLQVKLLRVLQEHEIQRVGSERSIMLDVRVIAATNRNLEADIEAERFRRDLYYRLGVVTLTVPPLRERKEDIPALVESYINYFRPRIGRPVFGISPAAIEALMSYPWPGNVRELMNVVERAMLLCTGREILPTDLPAAVSGRPARIPMLSLVAPTGQPAIPERFLDMTLRAVKREVLEELERAYLAGLLRRTGGRIGQTAGLAGIRPRSLFDKMKHFGLRKEDFRTRPGLRSPSSTHQS